MQNCCPIALLQVPYKFFAAMIKNRLLQTYEPWVQASQFGFRPKTSTSQAIFIARRLMDMSERTGTNLTITLLDWKMAFDKAGQQKLPQVLRRLQVPPRMMQAITPIYDSPQFRFSAGINRAWISNSPFRNKTGMSFITLPICSPYGGHV